MTEPDVASSDATNMEATAVVDGDEVVINGRKWWSTGVGHPDCKILVFMGLTDPDADRHHRHSMVLVPRDTPGVKVERLLNTMGMYDEPLGHGEVSFTDVRVPVGNILLGPGEAFAIAQGRLGPGRVHHCMRLIGLAELALELACKRGPRRAPRSASRSPTSAATASASPTPGSRSTRPGCWCCTPPGSSTPAARSTRCPRSPRSRSRCPNMAQQVIDMAIQIHGGGGLSDDFPLAGAWTARPRAAAGRRARRGAPRRGRPARARQVRAPAMSRVLVTGGRLRAGRRPGARRSRPAATRCSRTDLRPAADRRPGLDVTSDDDWAAALAHVERDAGAASTSWSTTPASPAAAGSTSPPSTSGSWITEINLFGVVRGTRTFVPMFKRQRSGHDRQRRLARRARAPGRDGVLQRRQGRRGRAHRDHRPRARGVRRARAASCARRTSAPT